MEDAAQAVEEGRSSILEILGGARRDLDFVLEDVERTLGRLTYVAPEVLSARAAVLSPILSAAMDRPEILINAYRRRFSELADRRLLEETAEAVIDGLAGSDGGAFAERWAAVQAEMAMGRSGEELQAVADREALQKLAKYLDSAERVVGFELASLDPRIELSEVERVAVQDDVAEIHRYETLYASS